MRLLLLVYPRTWRERYGEELTQLVTDVGLSPPVVLDVVTAGLNERARSIGAGLRGEDVMLEGPVAGHPRGLALLALVVLAPATVFVAGSVLAYQLGLTSLIGPMESINAWLAAQRVAGVVLMASPAVALLLALAPLVRLELRAGQSGSAAVVGIQTRLANLAVASLALIVGGLIAWHAIFESIAERAT